MLQSTLSVVVSLDSDNRMPTVDQRTSLLSAAEQLSIPNLLTLYSTSHDIVPESPSALIFDPAIVDWPSTELGQTLAATERNQLVVIGCWLEEAVSFFALQALVIGYDVYVVADAVRSITPEHQAIALGRLTQAGAVLTTTGQVLREWVGLIQEAETRTALKAFYEK